MIRPTCPYPFESECIQVVPTKAVTSYSNDMNVALGCIYCIWLKYHLNLMAIVLLRGLQNRQVEQLGLTIHYAHLI